MYLALIFMVLGGLVIWCSFIDAKWFFAIVKTKNTDDKLGHIGTRIVYGIIGVLLIVFSIALFMNI